VILHITSVTEREVKTVIVALGSISFVEFEYSKDFEQKDVEEMCIVFKGSAPDKKISSENTKSLKFRIFEYNDSGKALYESDSIDEFEQDYFLAMSAYLSKTEIEYLPV
jgi:hypothetical protein